MNQTSGQGIEAEDRRAPAGYRAYVGPPEFYDVLSAIQFNLLVTLGMRDTHRLLDIGCGSLRAGRLFIPYLRKGRYFGLEPVPDLIEQGLSHELGHDILKVKSPTFRYNADFDLECFETKFDFMLAQSIFSHTSRAQIEQCFRHAARVMQPQGIFAATFFDGGPDYNGDSWTVKALFGMNSMKAMAEDAGLECYPIDWAHVDLQTWIVLRPRGAGPVNLPDDPTHALVRMRDELTFLRDRYAQLDNSRVVRTARAVRDVARAIKYTLMRRRDLKSPKES